MNSISFQSSSATREQDEYPELLESICARVHALVNSGAKLFTTNAEGLWGMFLDGLPLEARQHYTCNACRHFVERHGGLVTIADTGVSVPVLWDAEAVPGFFRASISAIQKVVSKAQVNGVFVSSHEVLGQPVTGEWNHLSITLPSTFVFKALTQTASQRMAQHSEEFKMIIAGLLEYPLAAVEQAIVLLKSESLYRSEKCLGVAEWLRDLHVRRNATKNNVLKTNITWLATATAPIGYAHIRSTMIATLLDDIVAGMPFESVSRRFADKMHPLQYQRPQSAPSAGNIAQAEKVISELGAAGALERRFARLDELQLIWKPVETHTPYKNGNGVFSHIKAKGDVSQEYDMSIPAISMTWEKFNRTILPTAGGIEFFVTRSPDNYSAILTAVNPDAPPILQWDSVERRNPFSWYVYHNGSMASRFNLSPGFVNVTGVCMQPSMWTSDLSHQGNSVFFILDGARDVDYEKSGIALFPEILKSELHGIRAVLESYSRSKSLSGFEEASACGIRLENKTNWNALFRVKSGGAVLTYKLDRWD